MTPRGRGSENKMTQTNKKILVTGAAGFIGSHLSERLAPSNELVLVDDFSVGCRKNLASLEEQPAVSIVEADIADRETLGRLMKGVDQVYHLAVSCLRTSLGDPWRSHDVNAGGTLSVCEAADAASVERFVYVSSSEIYGSAITAPMDELHPCQPTTVYGASKLAGEGYALAYYRSYGMPVTVVRPFNTYGPREPYQGARAEVIPRFILRVLAGQPPVVYGDGSQTRDFTFVEDTVEGIVRAGQCNALTGEVVNIAKGREISIAEIARHVASALGRPDLEAQFVGERPGDVNRHFADITKASRLLDWSPQMEFESGLETTIAWFRSQDLSSDATREAALPNW